MYQKGNLKTKIIEKLLSGPTRIPSLIQEIAYVEKVSPQSVYTALRTLKKDEVVSTHNKQVSLSLIWLTKEKEKLDFSESAYKSSKQLTNLSSETKGKIIFSFKTINEMDLFWTHAYTILFEKMNTLAPQYSLMPHDFYQYGREATDTFWVEKNIKEKKNARLVITHTQPLDIAVMKARRGKLGSAFEFLLHQNPLKQKSNITYTITGDYIFKGVFDKRVNEKLELFVKNHKTLTLSPSAQKEIEKILSLKGKFTLTIEKNHKKSEAMEKKLKKYFE